MTDRLYPLPNRPYRKNGTRREHNTELCHKCRRNAVGSLDALDGSGTPIPFCAGHAPLAFQWDNTAENMEAFGRYGGRLAKATADRMNAGMLAIGRWARGQ